MIASTLLAVVVAGADNSAVDAWIRSRAEAYDAYFEAELTGLTPPPPDQLWRHRPASGVLHDFAGPTSLAPLVRAVRSGVVNISTVNQQGPEAGALRSLGSGFLINSEGYLVTNNHVVEHAAQIRVKLPDGREFLAESVGRDASTDVALLRLIGAPRDLPFEYLGDSDRLEVGDWVIAIGNPFGLGHSVAQGIISAKERVIGVGELDDFLQTDALINPGNSGGPLFNMRGDVIGVNTAIIVKGQGIGFAAPINLVKDLLPNLRANGHLERGWLGVNIYEERSGENSPSKGAVVKDVYMNSPAADVGFERGDRIVAVNGRPIESYLQLLRRVSLLPPGARTRMVLARGNAMREVTVTLGDRPAGDQLKVVPITDPGPLGLLVKDITLALAKTAGVAPQGGVWVSAVLPGSPAERAGVEAGDVILEVNQRPVKDVASYRDALEKTPEGSAPLMRVQRGKTVRLVAVGPS